MEKHQNFDIDFSLKGKTALVTGAGAGIGEAIAVMYARKGADVALVDMNLGAAEAVAAKTASIGRQLACFACDVAKEDDIAAMTKAVMERFGRVDILVNCAGVGLIDDAENIPVEWFDKTIAVNLRGPFLVSRHVGREMMKTGGGRIINMASQGGIVALDKHIAYNASKAGLISMTQVLALEWAEFNIQVNAISPTVILTEMGKRSWAGEVGENFKKKLPAHRFGYPEEVAAAAVYLASDAANLVTGANLVLDGGYTIQ